jgi:hypothetical protein
MSVIDCNCKGINTTCENCFGRGYYDDEQNSNISKFLFPKIEDNSGEKSLTFEQQLRLINVQDSNNIIKKLASLVDSKSIAQFDLLSEIYLKKRKPFLTKAKLNSKFLHINQLEMEKNILKDQIMFVSKSLNLNISAIYFHEFSKKKITHQSKLEVREHVKQNRKSSYRKK